MDDDLFTDELKLDERGANLSGSPRVVIASRPRRDWEIFILKALAIWIFGS